MAAVSLSTSTNPAPASPAAKPVAEPPSFFHQLLSELNPLQYVPVIGTIYRAVTGDTIPETARFAGSLVVSGLTGGPIGVALNVGITFLEHALGIDPEKIGGKLLADLGLGGDAEAPVATASAPAPDPASATGVAASFGGAGHNVAAGDASLASVAGSAVASASTDAQPMMASSWWSSAQLKAYGVSRSVDGTLSLGTVSGADVLNSLELARISNTPLDTAIRTAAA